jgi:HSP20 family protein
MRKNELPPRDWRDPARGAADEAHPLHSLQDRMNEVFEEMWQKIGRHHTAVSGRAYSGPPPHADLSEGSKDLLVEIELPGLDESDIEVLIDDGELTVRGEKKVEREESGRTYVLTERTYGRFARTFRLPPGADTDRAKATFSNGVLTVALPKKAGGKASERKIPIKSK